MPGDSLPVENILGRDEPQEHGEPMQPDDQKHPVTVEGGVHGQGSHTRRDRSQSIRKQQRGRKKLNERFVYTSTYIKYLYRIGFSKTALTI